MSGKVLVVGSLNMDLVVKTARHPKIGETILGGRFATFPGGKGANQAVAAARLGATVKMIGRVGKDAFGDELLNNAKKDGIDTSQVKFDDQEATGIALITVDEEGRNTIVVASGANFGLTSQDVHEASDSFNAADILVTQLENPMESIEASINLAAKNGMRVVLNPAPAQQLDGNLLSKIDFLIPNEHEVLQVVGATDLESAIDQLFELGVKNLIITMGEKGVMAITSTNRLHVPAYHVKAIDTVAAGDAFVGAFSAGLAEGMSTETAIRFGNAAAAISVTRPGAQPSLPTRREVDLFIAKNQN